MDKAQIEELYQWYKESTGVSIDSRTIGEGNMFFALKGENYDANSFALAALDAGAKVAIVGDKDLAKSDKLYLVEDTLEALQELAAYHRSTFEIPVIAITGSNGKTTTKEMLSVILAKKYKTTTTIGNLNNHIGVPLTLLSMPKDTEMAIIEIGANHLGEISTLCGIARPTHGLITNIGKAHTGGFGGLDGVIKGKGELYDYLFDHHGKVFINSNDPLLVKMGGRFNSPYYYPYEGDFYSCKLKDKHPFLEIETESGAVVMTKLLGDYNFANIATALCIGKYFEIDEAKAIEALQNFELKENRSQLIRRGTNTIILDAYNANPSSMKVALENIYEMVSSRKVLIIGDMNELGELTKEEHRLLVEKTVDPRFDQVFLCGKLIGEAAYINPEAKWFLSTGSLIEHLRENPIEDSLILIKASRSIGLEEIMEVF